MKLASISNKKIFGVLALVGTVFLIFLFSAGYEIYQSGFWRGPDAQFGDQHLKTTVALIELDKTRFGSYPKSLSELRFVGEWDKIALNSVEYTPSKDLDKYCVVVTRGWMGKPELVMPEKFWQGTGYDPSLCH